MFNIKECKVNPEIIIYTGRQGHLCDQAKDILLPLLKLKGLSLREVDITGDETLQEKYGLRIPVVALPNGHEKGWPFTAAQIMRLLS